MSFSSQKFSWFFCAVVGGWILPFETGKIICHFWYHFWLSKNVMVRPRHCILLVQSVQYCIQSVSFSSQKFFNFFARFLVDGDWFLRKEHVLVRPRLFILLVQPVQYGIQNVSFSSQKFFWFISFLLSFLYLDFFLLYAWVSGSAMSRRLLVALPCHVQHINI